MRLIRCIVTEGRRMVPPATVVPNPMPRVFLLRRPNSAAMTGILRRRCLSRRRISSSTMATSSSSSCTSRQSLRCAVLGAGFAGLSVAWNLLQLKTVQFLLQRAREFGNEGGHSPKDLHLKIDIFDEVGIGGGASGVSGGLLHPYSPKVKLLWRGAECWNECLELLRIAEAAATYWESSCETQKCEQKSKSSIFRRRGILRPAMNLKNLSVLTENAQKCLASCTIESIDEDAAQTLVPNLSLPFSSAFYMPEAVTIDPQSYLEGLFLACENLAKERSALKFGRKELYLHKKSIQTLLELADEYDAVVICLGARATMLPELLGRLPLRTCRGVIAHLRLPDDIGEHYPDRSPSILSNAWLAFHEACSLRMGSTWEWNSTNYSPNVSPEEASNSLDELFPKASAVYPRLKHWEFTEAHAGLRAMPPLTPSGSLPLLGCINDFVSGNPNCKYWLFGGLGARGLLYHGWLGKLMAKAVLSSREEVIPCELTSWKKICNRRQEPVEVLV